MAEREPAILRDTEVDLASVEASVAAASAASASGAYESDPVEVPVSRLTQSPNTRGAQAVHVVGFWRRAAAAVVDFAVVIPIALVITWIVSKIAGVHLPPSNLKVLDVDLWLDLILQTDPALVTALTLFTAIGLAYLLVCHIVLGRTLGMRVLKMRIIDVYGDRPSPARCIIRCAGYVASVATLFLGFLWMGFDSEKRALQDWLAGTYVIRA